MEHLTPENQRVALNTKLAELLVSLNKAQRETRMEDVRKLENAIAETREAISNLSPKFEISALTLRLIAHQQRIRNLQPR